jgi:hypothetical protein
VNDQRKQNDAEHPLVEENRILQVRLRLAQAFMQMLHAAFDALLHHNINYRHTPEYKDHDLLDSALDTENVEHGEPKVMSYIERVHHGINAAIRRKNFTRIK